MGRVVFLRVGDFRRVLDFICSGRADFAPPITRGSHDIGHKRTRERRFHSCNRAPIPCEQQHRRSDQKASVSADKLALLSGHAPSVNIAVVLPTPEEQKELTSISRRIETRNFSNDGSYNRFHDRARHQSSQESISKLRMVRILPIRCTSVTTVGLHQHKRAFKLTAMNFSETQLTRHAQDVVRKKERIETLQALLATHEAMGTEPDSDDVKELRMRLQAARTQLAAIG